MKIWDSVYTYIYLEREREREREITTLNINGWLANEIVATHRRRWIMLYLLSLFKCQAIKSPSDQRMKQKRNQAPI